MLTITTRYAGPTETRGSRIVASCHKLDGKRITRTRSYDSSTGTTENLHAAAVALMMEIDLRLSVVAEAWGAPGSLVTIVGDLS
jgi:hypothetical protein